MAACNLVTKNDGTYQNTQVAQEFLVEGSQTFMGSMLTITAQTFFAIDNLPKLVRYGPPPPTPEADMADGEIWAQYAAAMANAERAGIARQAPEIISGLPEFPTLTKMLDLGGGPGLIGIAIVAAHPNMSGTIFDKPAMVRVAETTIKEYGMEDRMSVMGGDFIHDPIGEGYDLIWASSSLSLARDGMDSLIAKIHDSLSPEGVFVVLHEGLTHERTKPDSMVLSMMPFALKGQDMRFDQGAIADSMLRVGFRSVRSRTLATDWGPMDLDVGRKA
ncbi:MAG: methyltransferase [Methanosarcinales archaeon]|nr:MAG: methyltransferase [Methanosarcinales archaeon]